MNMDLRLIDERVTTICELGCAQVRAVIAALRQGQEAPETRGVGADERQQILRELETIMAVYDAR
jgi:hypothetical protein